MQPSDRAIELSATQVAEVAGNTRLFNRDLAPTRVAARRWSAYNYAALWMGMAHCMPTWLMAGAVIDQGLSWWQGVLAIALGSGIVLVPILLNSHAGARYGIPFPVLARASFGVAGANVPALLRALVAAGWFGINTYIGGQALQTLVIHLFPRWKELDTGLQFAGLGAGSWITFLAFWALNLWVVGHGMEAVRRFEGWAGPAVLVLALGLLLWCYRAAGGWGPILAQPARLPAGTTFWPVFAAGVMAAVNFWATLSLNIPDFTRFARSQRDQLLGQAVGLPATMALFSLFAVLITSASHLIFGEALWDPVQLIGRLHSTPAIVLALVGVLVATLSVNVAANVVSPAYDFSNLWPARIDFRRGAQITGVLGMMMMPWKLLSSPRVYIFDWLNTYGVLLGPIAAIMIADYWLVRGGRLVLADLYRPAGEYGYWRGYNIRALTALGAGVLAALAARFAPGQESLAAFAWLIGFVVAFVAYRAVSPARAGSGSKSPSR